MEASRSSSIYRMRLRSRAESLRSSTRVFRPLSRSSVGLREYRYIVTAQELIAAVERTLAALERTYRGGATESDLYEASLLSVVVQAGRDAGGTALMTNDGVRPAAELRFRRSPGNLWSGNFTYAVISFPNTVKRLEAHLGVYVAGASGVAHECDVALLDQIEADRSRAGGVHPRRRGLVASVEAKHYVASPGIDVGRGFLGLAAELGQRRCCLSFPAKSSSSLAALIARRPSECFDELTPGGAAAARMRAHLDQEVRNWIA
jgi:hypothetical protein